MFRDENPWDGSRRGEAHDSMVCQGCIISGGHVRRSIPGGKPRSSAIDGRTLRHAGYGVSQRCRKRIEEVFGWAKSAAGLAKVKLRGRAKVAGAFTLVLVAYNLVRLPKLLAAPA